MKTIMRKTALWAHVFAISGCLTEDESTSSASGGEAGMSGQGGSGGQAATCEPSSCGVQTAGQMLCADGETSARGECRESEDGECEWVDECPEDVPCTPDECGPAPGAPQELCADGETWGGPGPCTRLADWSCGYPNVQCPDPDACEPGSSFDADDGCNSCECPESGLKSEAGCTEIGCGPNPGPDSCEPGSSFDAGDGCNTCECPESGLKSEAGCTEMDCGPNPGPDSCEPGSSFDAGDGCNSCQCPDSGLKSEAACTEAFCSGQCSNDSECLDTQFCDFEHDNCGISRSDGRCTIRPNTCLAGGVGACGCDGSARTNTCELNGSGVDTFRFGGCSFDDANTFVCGEMSCNAESDFCQISFNDVFGENEPEFYARCSPLPGRCPQGACDCFNLEVAPGAPTCFDGTGTTFLFYPGG